MIGFMPLASSSKGNAYLVTSGRSRVLLECGIPLKRLQQALDYRVQELDGCLITQEHTDHAGHVGQLLKRGVPVFASPGTAGALELEGLQPFPMLTGQDLGPPFPLGAFTVVPFRVLHDAAEPVGYLLQDREGDKLVFATDTVNLAYRFPGVGILAIEANYEEELLARHTKIPEQVLRRIRNSHMEIGRVCAFLGKQDLSRCREIWLLHLSDAASDEAQFVYLAAKAAGRGPRVLAAGK